LTAVGLFFKQSRYRVGERGWESSPSGECQNGVGLHGDGICTTRI